MVFMMENYCANDFCLRSIVVVLAALLVMIMIRITKTYRCQSSL